MAARPQDPLFTARTDQTRGVIRTRGHLDLISADLLERVVSALGHLGHRQIVVQLGPTTSVDRDALVLLQDLARRLSADGVRLRIEWPAAPAQSG